MEGLYPSEETEATAPPMEAEGEMESEEAPESIDAEEAEGETAIVDNKILAPEGGELKEGDEVVFVVVKNYGGESEVRRKTVAAAGGSVQPPGMMAEANAELDAMDQG